MAGKAKILGVVAWSLVVILLVGVVLMAASSKKQTRRADGFRDSLVQLGNAAGVEALAVEAVAVVEEAVAEAPAEDAAEGDAAAVEEAAEEEVTSVVTVDDAMIPTIVEQIQGAILGTQLELVSTKEALKKARTDASDAQTAADSFAQEQRETTEALSKEVAAKGEELDVAKADAEKAGEALEKAKKSAKKKQAKLEKKIAGLKTQMEEDKVRLQAEVDAVLLQMTEREAADAEPVVEEEEVIEEVEIIEEPGRVIGQSKMFTLIRYSAENETLFFQLQDGQTLNYQGIPVDVADNLLTAEDNLDMKYRFKIQGNYKSLPPDSVVIRKYWKNARYRPAKQDLRLIEDEALPEVEMEPVVAEVEEEAAVVEVEEEPAVVVVEEEAAVVEE